MYHVMSGNISRLDDNKRATLIGDELNFISQLSNLISMEGRKKSSNLRKNVPLHTPTFTPDLLASISTNFVVKNVRTRKQTTKRKILKKSFKIRHFTHFMHYEAMPSEKELTDQLESLVTTLKVKQPDKEKWLKLLESIATDPKIHPDRKNKDLIQAFLKERHTK